MIYKLSKQFNFTQTTKQLSTNNAIIIRIKDFKNELIEEQRVNNKKTCGSFSLAEQETHVSGTRCIGFGS